MPRTEFTHEDRRQFMQRITRTCLGVTFAGSAAGSKFLDQPAIAASSGRAGKAKHVIYLFMDGAMTHLDTFDPKVGVEEAGETKAIQTAVPGMQFGDRFPKLAKLAGALAVIRSLSTETGAHEQARYLMRTAYKQINSIRHPALGSWMQDQLGRVNKELPGNFLIGNGDRHPGAGFLEPSLAPVPIANPQSGLQNIKLPGYVDDTMFQRRLTLASRFDRQFQNVHKSRELESYNQLYHEARQLMGSEHLKVFNLKDEPAAVREAYGNNKLGQGCLLARRLVQSGARFVEVSDGGWDMHQDLYGRLTDKAAALDTALSSLLRDLHAKGMLDETLVVLTTEFGRKPNVNQNAGRDHHPGAFCSLLSGAGIKMGQVYGASDEKGHSVVDNHVTISDFNKTIAAAAGLPTDEDFYAPNGRPFKIGGAEGQPIQALLS
ncbi:DUF1501 domain-containing protein [Crateriforma conspicua]|uniref:Sulfatase n=1 Tax=Crateriforma conspicua TaxID=2527996 RepID=A0A5C5Y5T5_9PLAN|nr:DUF1501 domain-containing protein [Crateriforma conspicua]TWT69585.1 hypothetical protein Pan14r_18740 [Crateriforma conspicua]